MEITATTHVPPISTWEILERRCERLRYLSGAHGYSYSFPLHPVTGQWQARCTFTGGAIELSVEPVEPAEDMEIAVLWLIAELLEMEGVYGAV